MKVQVPPPVAAGIALVALVLILGFGWMKFNDNGERPNPRAGHPDRELLSRITVKDRNHETREEYANILRASRPDLSEAEVQAKADNFWKLTHPDGVDAAASTPQNDFSRRTQPPGAPPQGSGSS